MTKQELLNELNGFKEDVNSKISALEAVIKNMKDDDNDNILDEYIKGIDIEAYWLSQGGGVDYTYNGYEFNKNNSHPYHCYPTYGYAELAQKIKDFNDKLLAFKWCYDRDYEPDWNNYEQDKYSICYNRKCNKYDFDCNQYYNFNHVYFSSLKVAQQCCDWLNKEKKQEDDWE